MPWEKFGYKAHFVDLHLFAYFFLYRIFFRNQRLAYGELNLKEWSYHISVYCGDVYFFIRVINNYLNFSKTYDLTNYKTTVALRETEHKNQI